jgi:alpha-galactosidase
MKLPELPMRNYKLFLCTAALLLIATAALGQAGADETASLILTPKPGLAPTINGPKVYGARPGHPYLVPHPLHRRPAHPLFS